MHESVISVQGSGFEFCNYESNYRLEQKKKSQIDRIQKRQILVESALKLEPIKEITLDELSDPTLRVKNIKTKRDMKEMS